MLADVKISTLEKKLAKKNFFLLIFFFGIREMEDTTLDLPSLDQVLSQVTITSTVDLTKFLRTASYPLQHRLALAWAIQDITKVDGGKKQKDTIDRLSTILIRKHEVLVEWITSVMWREIKVATAKNEYQLYRDPAAINLLVTALYSIGDSQNSMDAQGLLGNGPFVRLFIDGLAHNKDAVYVAALIELWRFIVEQTKDGMEVLSAKPESLVQLLTTVGTQYLSTADRDVELQQLLLDLLSSLCLVMRSAFESTLSPRKCFGLFDEDVLPLCLRLVATIPEPCSTALLDMLQVGLFHVDPMKKFITELFDYYQNSKETRSTYVSGFFDIISKAMTDSKTTPDVVRQYASALPDLLSRFLQAAGLVCTETRNLVTTTVGLSAVAANPINRSRDDISNVCLRMFEIIYGWLEPPCKKHQDIVGSVNRLVGVYYQNSCFGTNNKASIVSSQTYQSQIKHLEGWLTTIVCPGFNSPSDATLKGSLEGISIALNARPDSVQQTVGDQMVEIFVRIPTNVVESATRVLKHLVETMAKTRQLDGLFETITRVNIGSSNGYVNLLESETFIRTLNQCVSSSMPFAQVLKCLEISIDAIIQAAAKDGSTSKKKKKRKLSKDGKADINQNIGGLVTIIANFALASISTVITEHQRGQYLDLISDKYKALVRKALADPGYGWERMLLHYTFMEIGARMDGAARWLEKSMDPERALDKVLDLSNSDPRTHALAMAVGFQMAAHWSGLVSSVSAGVSKISKSKSIDERTQMVRTTISRLLEGLQMNESMGDWNGQIQDITDRNSGTAGWALVKDWLELVCEYADRPAIDRICTRIVADMMASDPLNQQQSLLSQARFFEIPAIRRHLVPAMLTYANSKWQQDTADHGKSSHKLVGQITDALTRLKDPKQSSQGLVEIIMDCIDEGSDKMQLPSTIVRPWVQLTSNLLRFPTAYWTHHHRIIGLALVCDLGISQIGQRSEDTARLQQHSRALLERSLGQQQHSSSLLLLDAKHTIRLFDRWQSDSSGNLLQLVVRSMAKAAFGYSNQQADQVCRRICKHLVDQQSAYVLNTLGVVSRIAHHNSQKLADNQQQLGEWKDLVKPWLKQYQKRVLKTDSLYDLGMYMEASHLYASMDKPKAQKKQAEVIQHLASQLADSKSSNEYALGLVFILVRLEVGSKTPQCVPTLLAHMIKYLSLDSPPPMSPVLRFLTTNQQMPLDTAIIQLAAIPLLRQVDAEIFTTSFSHLLINLRGNGAIRLLAAFIQTAYRPGTTNDAAVAKRKSVQRQLGCLLSALHTALDGSTALLVIQIISDLVLEASIRFSTSDIGQALSIIHTTLVIPGIPSTVACELFAKLCKLLGSILRYHSEQGLTSISLVVELIRTLLHAFAAPDFPRHHKMGTGSTPWIVSQAPLPPASAHAYARMIFELTNIKKINHKQHKSQMLVKETRGTSTASASSLLSLFVPTILAEYCVIQGGATRFGNQITSQSTGHYGFLGLCWKSTPIIVPSEAPTVSGTGIIGNPLVRDALMPGWYALLDIVSSEDRASLLTLLASPPPPPSLSLKGGCTGSVLGPVRYGGADEVLKALYQSYLDFYKYSGQI